jgi:hypothetical protein
MKEIPEDISSNPTLEALQHLLYDDTPENLATHFNQKGNEFLKKGPDSRYFLGGAKKAYTQGIE